MKRYETANGIYLYGPTEDVKECFKSISRASKKKKTSLVIPYSKNPIFAKRKKMYALHLDQEKRVHVISSDEMMAILCG